MEKSYIPKDHEGVAKSYLPKVLMFHAPRAALRHASAVPELALNPGMQSLLLAIVCVTLRARVHVKARRGWCSALQVS